MAAEGRPGAREAERQAEGIPTLEWVVGGAGLAILAAVLGFLLYTAFREESPLPDVRMSADQVLQTRNGYLVRITVRNEGGSTAEGVIVEGELWGGGAVVERSRTVIEYLPSRSRKQIGLFFSNDPKRFDLKMRPHGYEEP
jgi:uncharacterized protein (TIGR02588 family)